MDETDLSRSREADPLFEVALYLVASARDCIDEPLIYGPLRMVEGVSRLVEAAARLEPLSEDPFLLEAKATIDREKYNVMADRDAFVAWLDDLLAGFALEAKRRNLGVE